MKKLFLLIAFFTLIFNSCVTKNSYNQARFKQNRFKIKPNNNLSVFRVIDTSAFYLKINEPEKVLKHNLQSFKTGLKFYDNGRIGFFKGIDFSDISSFNPQKASMAYYNKNPNGFFIESIFPTPGGKYFLSKSEVIKINGDTITIFSAKTPRGGGYKVKYLKVKLKKDFLIYKPDW